ncbi:hypothetical protein GBAR_LOCUS21581 [Geodia barretti]|uniref:Uncharacterized protein n=1 Tax=Geodia barretti TaxID=519541 RepID=A0AA35WYL3_GEOBA|nr:hypothetical protein GBAR_LOCUS21581 [Geodia barretti]
MKMPEEAHFCFLIEDRMDGCPVPFPFQIYLSTITGTADSPGDFSAVRQQCNSSGTVRNLFV